MTSPSLTFIGIGAQKCASTWIYDILADHPEVAVTAVKEIDFFSYHYDRGIQWYLSQFPLVTPATRAAGEISPSYFHEPAVPARVKAHFPDSRIIVSLRDPVERALSNHRHEVRVGHFSGPDLSFEKGLSNNPTYLQQGLYATHLQRWLEYFPRDRLLILLLEDIDQDRDRTARRVYEFLGVDTEHQSAALQKQSNPSHAVRSRRLENVRIQIHNLADRLGLAAVLRAASRLGSHRLYSVINRTPSEAVIPPIQEETLVELRAYFADEVSRLETLIGRDLKHWRP